MNSTAREAVVSDAMELVSRPSENPPGDESQVADWLVDRLDSSRVPITVERTEVEPGRPNVVARVGNPERGSILLTGHTDVVPANPEDWASDPYEPEVRDGRLFGRGTADMKGALAAKIIATERYVEHTDEPEEVILAFVVDEENNGLGIQALIEAGLDADVALIGEPTGMNVCTAIKGVSRYKVTVRGESCHSGKPDEGRDAIRGLKEVLDRVVTLDDELEPTSHPVLANEDATVTEVDGGIAPNVVADSATATVDWRFHPGTTVPEPFDERLSEVLEGVTVDGKPLDVSYDRSVFARAGETDPNHPLVTATLDSGRQAGADTELVGFDAATDARYLIHDAGIPTVHFGPGSITDDAHTVDESVSVDELVQTVSVYETLLDRVFE